MQYIDELDEWMTFTEETVEALIADGSDVSQPHVIEYYFASDDFDVLEKMAVDAFKANFEVTDAEELEDEDGHGFFAFDVIVERRLDVDIIKQDVEQLDALAKKHNVMFDGWGTHFIEADTE